MDPADILVAVEGDVLLISGERPNPAMTAKACLRIERPHGFFERRFALPDDASREEVASALERGVLELHVRKVRAVAAAEPAPVNAPPRLKLRPAHDPAYA
jgi:HSP20 family molecular chaperone IbpA